MVCSGGHLSSLHTYKSDSELDSRLDFKSESVLSGEVLSLEDLLENLHWNNNTQKSLPNLNPSSWTLLSQTLAILSETPNFYNFILNVNGT